MTDFEQIIGRTPEDLARRERVQAQIDQKEPSARALAVRLSGVLAAEYRRQDLDLGFFLLAALRVMAEYVVLLEQHGRVFADPEDGRRISPEEGAHFTLTRACEAIRRESDGRPA